MSRSYAQISNLFTLYKYIVYYLSLHDAFDDDENKDDDDDGDDDDDEDDDSDNDKCIHADVHRPKENYCPRSKTTNTSQNLLKLIIYQHFYFAH